MSGDAKIWRRLSDVHLTSELCADATIEQRYVSPQCCRMRTGTDAQSDLGCPTRCNRPSVVGIRLHGGQHYNLCEDHARLLGVLPEPPTSARGNYE
jgi:hypothetical protein